MPTTNKIGIEIIKDFEGCHKAVAGGRFTTYVCPAGVTTIGYGHTNLGGVPPVIKTGDTWSLVECEGALANDLAKFEARIRETFKGVTLNDNEFGALVSFDFNTGGINKSSIPAKIKGGRRSEVYETLLRWNKASGREMDGLTRRRKSEGALFEGRADEALRFAGSHKTSGQLMAQAVDRPTIPAAEVVRRAPGEIAVLGTGGAAAAGGQVAQPSAPPKPPATTTTTTVPDKPAIPPPAPKETHGLATAAFWIGLVIVCVGILLFARRWQKESADWA